MSFGGGSEPQFGERAEPGPNDVCYRHKDRPTFTLCQRCGRTICPECQQVSAVGVLCPDCVRAAQPGAAKRMKRGAQVTARKLSDADKPVITYGIMAVSVVVFGMQWLASWVGSNGVTAALAYAPAFSLPEQVSAMFFSGVAFEPWRMITAMFTHSTGFLLHILFNMFALWLFGPNLERMLGRAMFAVLYLLSGLGGSIGVMLWVYFAPNALSALATSTVGASGAIFGLLMATLVAYRAHKVNITSLAVLIGINFAIGFMPGSSISWQAHLGGMVAGAIVMSVLLATTGPRRAKARIWSLIGVTAAFVAVCFSYFVFLPL